MTICSFVRWLSLLFHEPHTFGFKCLVEAEKSLGHFLNQILPLSAVSHLQLLHGKLTS